MSQPAWFRCLGCQGDRTIVQIKGGEWAVACLRCRVAHRGTAKEPAALRA